MPETKQFSSDGDKEEFLNPPAGPTYISHDPELWERLRHFLWMRLSGQEPGKDISYGMIPIDPSGMVGATRGMSQIAKGVMKKSAEHPASAGGISGELTENFPIEIGRPYSLKNIMNEGNTLPGLEIPLSDTNMRGLMHKFGEMNPAEEGKLVERMTTTPSDPAEHATELMNLLRTMTGPIFRTKPKMK